MSAEILKVMVEAGLRELIAENTNGHGVITDFDDLDEAGRELRDTIEGFKAIVRGRKAKQRLSQ